MRNTTKSRLKVKGDTRTAVPSLHPGGVTDPVGQVQDDGRAIMLCWARTLKFFKADTKSWV